MREGKVLVVALNFAPEVSGNAPYTTDFCHFLASVGFATTVVTTYPHYPSWRVLDGHGGWRNESRVGNLRVIRLAHFVPRTPSMVARVFSEISFGLRLTFMRYGAPDVVVCVSPALLSSALAVARFGFSRKRPRFVLWVQDIYSQGVSEIANSPTLATHIARKLEGLIFKAFDEIVTIHDRLARVIVGRLGVEARKLHVVRNWSHMRDEPEIDRSSVRRRLGWGDGETVLLHAGNQGVKQGLENVVEVAKLADAKGLPLKVVLLGDGSQHGRLKELGSGLRSLDFIPSLPPEQFVATLSAADVLLVSELPSLKATCVPSKLTSYFNAGRPIIAMTGIDSVTADEVKSSGAGVCVNPLDTRSVLDVALKLSGSSTAGPLGERGREYARRFLSPDASLKKLSSVISSLIPQTGKAG